MDYVVGVPPTSGNLIAAGTSVVMEKASEDDKTKLDFSIFSPVSDSLGNEQMHGTGLQEQRI